MKLYRQIKCKVIPSSPHGGVIKIEVKDNIEQALRVLKENYRRWF